MELVSQEEVVDVWADVPLSERVIAREPDGESELSGKLYDVAGNTWEREYKVSIPKYKYTLPEPKKLWCSVFAFPRTARWTYDFSSFKTTAKYKTAHLMFGETLACVTETDQFTKAPLVVQNDEVQVCGVQILLFSAEQQKDAKIELTEAKKELLYGTGDEDTAVAIEGYKDTKQTLVFSRGEVVLAYPRDQIYRDA